MNSKTLLYGIALILTAGIGFGLGWIVKPGEPGEGDRSATLEDPDSLLGARRPASTPEPVENKNAQPPARNESDAGAFLEKYLSPSGTLAPDAMKKAVAEALKEGDLIKANGMVAAILENLTAENAAAAFEALSEAGPRDPSSMYTRALFGYAWGQLDGPAAIAAAQEAGGPAAMMATASTMSGWATAAPEEALAWLEEQDEGPQKMMYAAGMINGLARSDPLEATRLIESMEGDANSKDRYLEIVATQQLKNGIDAATDWAASFSDDQLKANAFENVATQFTQQDPVKAAEWVERYAGDGYAQKAVTEVADEWAESDPAAAVAWAGTLPAETQTQAMSSAFQEWAESDPTTASQYLTEMPPGLSKDGAISGFTAKLAGEDPEAAITWAGTIDNETIRIDALTAAAQTWYRQNQEAASAWLETSALPPEARERVTQAPARPAMGDFFGGRIDARLGR